MRRIFIPIALYMLAGSSVVVAADEYMTGAELTTLIGEGKTINLGGEGEGYAGTLEFRADGTASGSAKTDDGKTLVIEGTWKIKNNQFCRKWDGFDNAKTVCESWKKIGENRVEVQMAKKKIGVNWW
jgi:hypothetical protein